MKCAIAWGYLCLAVFLAPPVRAQGAQAPIPGLSLSWGQSADSLALIARVTLPAGWYINSNAPLDSFLVPTRLEAAVPGGASAVMPLRFGSPRWPAPVIEHSPAMGGNMSLFKEAFVVTLPALPNRSARPADAGEGTTGKGRSGKASVPPDPPPSVRATLHYQSCDGAMCWPPKSVSAVLEGGISRQE